MPDSDQLSERELEILRLVATGASNKDIARDLVISVNTVKVHLRNIFGKLGVSSRTEATIYAVKMGIVQPELNQPSEDFSGDTARLADDKWRRYRWLILVVSIVVFLIVGIIFVALRDDSASGLKNSETFEFQDETRWQEHAKMLTPRKGFAGTVYDNQIYIIGGETSNGVIDLVERYIPEKNDWEVMRSKDTAVTDISAVAIGGLIYVPGGRLETGEVTDKLEVYDPLENRWSYRSPLPEAVSAYALAAFEGKMYLFGGWDGNQFVGDVYIYDPFNDTWVEGSSMPTARGFAGVGVANGKIFVFGGINGEKLSVNEVYQPSLENSTGTPWEQRTTLPDKRYAMGAVSVADIIHVIGGDDVRKGSMAWKYFPHNDQWVEFQVPADQIWMHLGVVSLGTRIYALGGEMGGKISNVNSSYQAIYTITIPVIR